MSKKELGQFYTTNANYIVGDLLNIYPKNSIIVDPFAGNWDLLDMVKAHNVVEAYDIDPKNNITIKQDTIINPPNYTGKWIITNPPYLAKNKTKNKTIYNKYNVDDLYKASMISIDGCEGGILVIPLNFISSRDFKFREQFLSKYIIKKLKIFEETVFSDTTYIICAFSFIKGTNTDQNIDTYFYPSKENIILNLSSNNGYSVAKDFEELLNINYNVKIGRLLKNDKYSDEHKTNIYLNAIDTGSNNGRIRLEFSKEYYYGKNTDRSFASIFIDKKISIENQKIIIKEFNDLLEFYRIKHNSLFLTNFRNATKSYARKRIEFKMAYDIIKYIMFKYNM